MYILNFLLKPMLTIIVSLCNYYFKEYILYTVFFGLIFYEYLDSLLLKRYKCTAIT